LKFSKQWFLGGDDGGNGGGREGGLIKIFAVSGGLRKDSLEKDK